MKNPAFRDVKSCKTIVRNYSRTLKFGKCATNKNIVYNTYSNPVKAFYMKRFSSRD